MKYRIMILISVVLASLGLGFGYGWGFGVLSVESTEPPTTLEAWGVGYQQGFNDLRTLHQQQEMMFEHLEHSIPGHQDSVRGGADRDGATISGPWGTKVPPTADRERQQPWNTGDASDWESGPFRIS